MKIIRKNKKSITTHRLELQGSFTVVMPDGRTLSDNGAAYDAARLMITDGVPPTDRLEFYRGQTLCLSGTVQAFALRAWGGKSQDPFDVKWRPSPFTTMSPRLASWWDNLQT